MEIIIIIISAVSFIRDVYIHHRTDTTWLQLLVEWWWWRWRRWWFDLATVERLSVVNVGVHTDRTGPAATVRLARDCWWYRFTDALPWSLCSVYYVAGLPVRTVPYPPRASLFTFL